jgi:hypothetical protein
MPSPGEPTVQKGRRMHGGGRGRREGRDKVQGKYVKWCTGTVVGYGIGEKGGGAGGGAAAAVPARGRRRRIGGRSE